MFRLNLARTERLLASIIKKLEHNAIAVVHNLDVQRMLSDGTVLRTPVSIQYGEKNLLIESYNETDLKSLIDMLDPADLQQLNVWQSYHLRQQGLIELPDKESKCTIL